jgi:hypothetical protein
MDFIKNIECSISLNLGILVNLDHFRHSFITQFQSFITRGESKINYDKVELEYGSH